MPGLHIERGLFRQRHLPDVGVKYVPAAPAAALDVVDRRELRLNDGLALQPVSFGPADREEERPGIDAVLHGVRLRSCRRRYSVSMTSFPSL